MKAEPDTKAEILNIMDRIFKAYSQKKLDELVSFFLPEPDVTLIGIGGGQKYVGLENIKSHLRETIDQSAQIISTEFEDPIISEKGGIAWISTGVKVQFEAEGQPVNFYYRNTATYVKQNDKWLIAQMHNSAPLGGPE
jgi:ketosteroid isomerase-like protein